MHLRDLSPPQVYIYPMRTLVALALFPLLLACDTKQSAQNAIDAIWASATPDELPVILNKTLPFHYPSDLYGKKVQGNVLLRIFIDADGRVHPESTSVATSSGYPAFDSAAVKGVEELRFTPAKTGSDPMSVSIQFPVYFRHPDAAPLPGDTILGKPAATSRKTP